MLQSAFTSGFGEAGHFSQMLHFFESRLLLCGNAFFLNRGNATLDQS